MSDQGNNQPNSCEDIARNNDGSTVRVVVPTLGTRPQWLMQCLQSIQLQAQARVTVVVVCPAAAASAVGLIAAQSGSSVRVSNRPGLSAAINDGMKGALEDYFAWLGDDDLLAPGTMTRAVSTLDGNASSPYVYGRTRYIDERGTTIGFTRPGPLAWRYLPIGKDFVPQPGSLIRSSAWKAVGGIDEALKNAMDLDLFLRLSRVGRPAYLPIEVSAYRLHRESITLSKGQADEAEAVRNRYRSGIVRRASPLWRPLVGVIDRGLDGLTRRLPFPDVPTLDSRMYTKALGGL